MSKYTRQDLIDMQDDELEVVYEEVLEKSYPSTKKRKDIVAEILAAQKEKEEEEEEEERVSEKKKKTAPKAAPVSSVRSTLLKPNKSPLKSKPPQVVQTVDPLLISQALVEEELMPEEEEEEVVEKKQTKRGRPPKKIEKLSLSTSSEEIERYQPPKKTVSEPSRIDTILDRIKKSAKVDLLNPKASFQKGDVVREREPEISTPIVVDANLVSIELPVHEEAKKSITDFLHDIGFQEGEETVPSPKKVVSPKKKGAPVVSVDEELERLASGGEPEDEEEFFTLGEPVSVVKSVEPRKSVSATAPSATAPSATAPSATVPIGKQEKSMTKSIKEILEQEEAEKLEEELRYAKEKEIEAEKERELEKRTLESERIKKKISRRPVLVQETTAEGEEIGEPEVAQVEEVAEPEVAEPEISEPEVAEPEDEDEKLKQQLLRSPAKWKNIDLADIPFSEFKNYKPKKKKAPIPEKPKATVPATVPAPSSKKKEKKETITTEIEEPEPLVVKKTVKKTEVKETPSGRKDVVKSVREQIEEVEEEEPKSKPPSKPSSKKKKAAEVVEEEEEEPKSKPPSKPSSKKKKAAEVVDVLPILQQVDRSKMAAGRGKNFYGTKDLQDILRQLPGVKISQKKKEELVATLDEWLTRYGL
jgi:hypothetical protein